MLQHRELLNSFRWKEKGRFTGPALLRWKQAV